MTGDPGRAPAVLPPKYDVFAISARHDPYPAYAEMRSAGPVCRAGPGQWAVTRYDEVAALLRDERLVQFQFSEAYQLVPGGALDLALADGEARSFTRRTVVALDRPEHTPVRQVLARALKPALDGFAPRIAAIADELLDRAEDQGTFDAVTGLAHPLPFRVLCELLSVPDADRAEVGRRASDVARAFALVVGAEASAVADDAVQWLRGYFHRLLADRGRDDLLSRMRQLAEGTGVTVGQLADNAIFLLLAGLETSVNLITSGCLALARHPDQADRVRAEPALLPVAVEEFLRFDAPTRMTARLTKETIRVGDRTIRSGRVVVLLLGSANHDGRRFDRPERLDVTRSPNPHLAFGGGAHYCLGAILARMEAAVVFGRLLHRFGRLSLAAEPTREASIGERAYASAPMLVERR